MSVEYSFIIAVIPVILVVAFLVWIAKKITDGERLDMKEGVLGVVILMIAVLIMVPMVSSTQVYTWDEDTGKLVIQQNISGGSYAWDSYDDQIRSIVIKPGVTQIGNSAFDGATNLEYLTIPESVTDIGTNAFSVDFVDPYGEAVSDIAGRFAVYEGAAYLSDPSLYKYSNTTEINGFANGVSGVVVAALPTENDGHEITAISARAFRDNAELVYVTDFPDSGIDSTGINSFTSCTALERATLWNATNLGSYTFQGCTSLAGIKAPSLVTLGNYAFDASGITEADFPKVTSIGQRCFRNCASLATALFPAAVTMDGDSFNGCTSLATIEFPVLKSVGSGVFTNAIFATADMPELETIGNYAFQGCASMTSANIPKATSIGTRSFNNCTGIEEVTFGPLETVASDSFNSWTFYASDGTTTLDKTDAANLAGKTFQGTASALIEVSPGLLSLTPQQIQQVHLHDTELQDLKDQISIEPLPLQPSLQEQELTA